MAGCLHHAVELLGFSLRIDRGGLHHGHGDAGLTYAALNSIRVMDRRRILKYSGGWDQAFHRRSFRPISMADHVQLRLALW
jgi:hypothetical protein